MKKQNRCKARRVKDGVRCSRQAVKDGFCTKHHPDYVRPSLLFHIHDEQFDGHRHAWCGAGDAKPGEPAGLLIVDEDEFAKIPAGRRCQKCEAEFFPHGGVSAYSAPVFSNEVK